MHIWIDGDACPKIIKEPIFRAAVKRQVVVTIVTNHVASIRPSPYIKRVQVDLGLDKADDYIVTHLTPGDLVITADIILADEVINRHGIALNPRGTLYTSQNIRHILAMRHLHESLRESGLMRGGMGTITDKEVQQFLNHFDRIITASQR